MLVITTFTFLWRSVFFLCSLNLSFLPFTFQSLIKVLGIKGKSCYIIGIGLQLFIVKLNIVIFICITRWLSHQSLEILINLLRVWSVTDHTVFSWILVLNCIYCIVCIAALRTFYMEGTILNSIQDIVMLWSCWISTTVFTCRIATWCQIPAHIVLKTWLSLVCLILSIHQ